MAQIPLIATDPDLTATLTPYVAGEAGTLPTHLTNNQTAILSRISEVGGAVEMLAEAFGNGALTGGTITAGVGLSVNVAALTAIVGTWVGFDASQVVSGLSPHTLTDNSLNYLFLRQDGTWYANTTGTTPASTDGHGYALLWGTATTSAGAVTSVDNTRISFLQRLARIPILSADPPSPQTGWIWWNSTTGQLKIQGGGTLSAGGGGGGGGGLNPTGNYDNAHTYAINDVVEYGTPVSSYYAIATGSGNLPTDPTHWKLLAAGVKGDPGDPGPPGPPYTPVPAYAGAWSSGTAYTVPQIVTYAGSVYIATANSTNQNPATATAYWDVLIPAGAPGIGTAGSDGIDGSTWFVEDTPPDPAQGVDTDVWYYTVTNDLYQKIAGVWTYRGNNRGLPGTKGQQGPAGTGSPTILANPQTGTAYTLVLSDASLAIEQTNASACTLTVPPNSAVPFALGTTIEVLQGGAGAITITPGAGVTIHSRGGLMNTNGQWAVVRLRKQQTDTWILQGDRA